MGAEPFSSWQASSWQVWALLSAVFAALTAIFAKVGVENINPDLACRTQESDPLHHLRLKVLE
jgi:hypothetical protein